MRLWTFLLLCLASSTASAFLCCDGCWDLGVDLLYLKPVHCPITYAQGETETNGVETLREYLAKGSYDWGFRVKADYTSCCFALGLSYSYLKATDDAKVCADGMDLEILGQDEEVDFAKTSLSFRWQQFDLKGYHLIHQDCGCRCSLTGLVRWADIEMKNRTVGTDAPSSESLITRSLTQSCCFDGVGLGVGLCGDYCLPCNLSVGGHLDIAALIGDRKVGKLTNMNYEDDSTAVRLADSSTAVVPNLEFALFINYTRQVCCRLWSLELGYEFHYFLEALRFATAHDSGDDYPVINCNDVGFAGPYLGLSLSF